MTKEMMFVDENLWNWSEFGRVNLKEELQRLNEKYESLANQNYSDIPDQISIKHQIDTLEYDSTISVPWWDKNDIFWYSLTHEYWECILTDAPTFMPFSWYVQT